jgi:hypothetical protein
MNRKELQQLEVEVEGVVEEVTENTSLVETEEGEVEVVENIFPV